MAGNIIPGRATSARLARRGRRRVRRTVDKAKAGAQQVPGPSTNPATNLLIADVAMNAASMLFRRGIERAALSLRFDREKAKQVVQGRSMVETSLSYFAARQATRSVPGFLLVTGGLFAKSVLDRAKSPRQARQEGEAKLLKQAENAAPEEGE